MFVPNFRGILHPAQTYQPKLNYYGRPSSPYLVAHNPDRLMLLWIAPWLILCRGEYGESNPRFRLFLICVYNLVIGLSLYYGPLSLDQDCGITITDYGDSALINRAITIIAHSEEVKSFALFRYELAGHGVNLIGRGAGRS